MFSIKNIVVLCAMSGMFLFSPASANDTNYVTLPELEKPETPKINQGESSEAFAKRVLKLHAKRVAEVFPIQKKFRLEVENNNRHLSGAEKQSPSLIDRNDPLFLAYKDARLLKQTDSDLLKMLDTHQKKFKSNRSWLIIISIEEYKYTDNVLFANRTAEIMKRTFQKKLDIAEKNILMLSNEKASLKNIKTEVRKFIHRVRRNDIIYFYYSGHGLSNQSGEQLLLPYDGKPDFPNSKNSIKIERLYSKFLNSKSLRTFSFIDASFNGITDGAPVVKGLDSVEMRPRAEGYHKRLNILNSARAQDASNAYYTKGYRLFSYFLVKEVLSKPQSAGELFDNIRTEVRKVSYEYGEKYLQEPEFFGYRELSIKRL